MMKNLVTICFLVFCTSLNSLAQSSAKELSSAFTTAFFQNNIEKLEAICSTNPETQTATLTNLKTIYKQGQEMGIKWAQIASVSSSAIFKDNDTKSTHADIIITFKENGAVYKISIWDCFETNGTWKLGSKSALRKM